jgi:hypothetical protein
MDQCDAHLFIYLGRDRRLLEGSGVVELGVSTRLCADGRSPGDDSLSIRYTVPESVSVHGLPFSFLTSSLSLPYSLHCS